MDNRTADVSVSSQFLLEALKLPWGTEVAAASYDPLNHVLRLRVRHFDLPLVPEGQSPPQAEVEFERVSARYIVKEGK